jgi:hypothetical protein
MAIAPLTPVARAAGSVCIALPTFDMRPSAALTLLAVRWIPAENRAASSARTITIVPKIAGTMVRAKGASPGKIPT